MYIFTISWISELNQATTDINCVTKIRKTRYHFLDIICNLCPRSFTANIHPRENFALTFLKTMSKHGPRSLGFNGKY